MSKSKKKNVQFFSLFLESTYDLKWFERKDEPQRLFVSALIDYKMRGYLNASKAPCKNTYGQSTC